MKFFTRRKFFELAEAVGLMLIGASAARAQGLPSGAGPGIPTPAFTPPTYWSRKHAIIGNGSYNSTASPNGFIQINVGGSSPSNVLVSDNLCRSDLTSGATRSAIGVRDGGATTINIDSSNLISGPNWSAKRSNLASDGAFDPATEVSEVSSDADVTFTVLATTPVVIHTGTLTNDRTITLSTTNAVNGNYFEVVRTGSGAHNLNVGSLVNLTTGTTCKVVFENSAWTLAETGTV